MSSVSKPRVRHNRHKQGLNLTLEKLSADFRFNTNTVYYWNGGKLSITDKRAEVLKVFVDSAPEYRLLKEDICRRIWNRDSKDAQALYNVAMSELRSYLIAEDDSLELKTLTNEGVVLIVDIKRKRKFPLLHFIGRIKG